MIRLFTALALPDDLCLRLAGLQGGIDGARWVPPENMHITLRFVGEVPETTTDDIVDALDRVRGASFAVTLSGAGQFASRGRTRAVWVGVEKTPEIAALHDKIDQALIRIGLPPEGRKYSPHVTIARLKDARPNRVFNWLEATGGFFAAPFDAPKFILYESRLGRNGPSYAPVAEFPLSG